MVGLTHNKRCLIYNLRVVCKVLILRQAASATCASTTMRFCDNALLRHALLRHALLGQCASGTMRFWATWFRSACPRSALSQKRIVSQKRIRICMAQNMVMNFFRNVCKG